MSIDQLILSLMVMIILNFSNVLSACGRAEYLIGSECCPMCAPGYYVRKHCTEYTSTTCIPCPSLTYVDAPNGLVKCKSCTVCDTGAGLTVKQACTSISDTLCTPLEGHYCTEPVQDSCQGAEKHTMCEPGQYIKLNGTAFSDTLCGDCGLNTYSDGSFTFCRPHTQCEIQGLEVIKDGSSSHDTECSERKNHTVTIIGLAVAIIAFSIVGAAGIAYGLKKSKQRKEGNRKAKDEEMRNTLRNGGDRQILQCLVIIAVILLLTVPGVCPACGQAEYLIGEECCAMCTPGRYVRRHCTEFTSTTCVPCLPSTFTDAPNGLESCMSCKICDLTRGLKVKRACSSTMDALCEPLEGHYCTDPTRDDCRGAVEHTKCKPGQYIKQPGTSTSDSICGDCVGDTYSNGSFTSCRPHTQCEVMGLLVTRKGSTTSDTECGERKNTAAIIAGVISFVILFFFLIGVLVYLFMKK